MNTTCCNKEKCGSAAKWCNTCVTKQCDNDLLVTLLKNMFDNRYEELSTRLDKVEDELYALSIGIQVKPGIVEVSGDPSFIINAAASEGNAIILNVELHGNEFVDLVDTDQYTPVSGYEFGENWIDKVGGDLIVYFNRFTPLMTVNGEYVDWDGEGTITAVRIMNIHNSVTTVRVLNASRDLLLNIRCKYKTQTFSVSHQAQYAYITI